jgi:hypothetical protein
MEVHKHSHGITHTKRWPEYLLEFFMLFLAVFLGFVAENVRENSVERHREREYMQSLLNDLKTDTSKLGQNIIVYKQYLLRQDTLLKTFRLLDQGFNKIFFRNLGGIKGFPDFIYTDATIQQLKNSGGFRLVRHHNAVQNIMAYDAIVKKALINEKNLGDGLQKMDEYGSEFFNRPAFNEQIEKGRSLEEIEAGKLDWIFSHDKIVMSKYFNKILSYKEFFEVIIGNMEDVKSSAIILINYLQKEYNLD